MGGNRKIKSTGKGSSSLNPWDYQPEQTKKYLRSLRDKKQKRKDEKRLNDEANKKD